MKHLTTSTDAQIVKIIPRSYVSNATLKLRDDSTNTEVSYSVTPTTDGNYLVISNSYALVEGRFYDLTLLDGTEVIYKDKVFCTDQTISQPNNDYYTVNKDVYKSDTSFDNEFIIL